MRIKAGDRVKVVASYFLDVRNNVMVGNEYSVLRVDGYYVYIEVAGDSWAMEWDQVEKVEDDAKTGNLNPGARFPSSLPAGSAERKEYPLYSVLFGYFPAAMNALAHHAYKSNDKHNPGKPLQWSRNNSDDHAECLLRHLQEGDYEGVMWRAAALLQLAKEKEGAPVAPLATFD